MASQAQAYEALFDLILDPTLLDLVLAMPSLTWNEIACTAGVLLFWDFVSKPLAWFLWRRSRRPLSWGLFRLAMALKP